MFLLFPRLNFWFWEFYATSCIPLIKCSLYCYSSSRMCMYRIYVWLCHRQHQLTSFCWRYQFCGRHSLLTAHYFSTFFRLYVHTNTHTYLHTLVHTYLWLSSISLTQESRTCVSLYKHSIKIPRNLLRFYLMNQQLRASFLTHSARLLSACLSVICSPLVSSTNRLFVRRVFVCIVVCYFHSFS